MTDTSVASVVGTGGREGKGAGRIAPPVSTTNACRMCMPLGASLAFSGVAGCVPFLHGSQGCATYIRRYLISHFNEPLDIASSSFGEASTVFGGETNLREGLANVTETYAPAAIGVATTCLTETIGEDVASMLDRVREERSQSEPIPVPDPGPGAEAAPGPTVPLLVHVPTPSYAGTHADGYHAAVAAIVDAVAGKAHPTAEKTTDAMSRTDAVALLPGIVSAADLRHLRELAGGFDLPVTLLPDYSERLDAPAAARYDRLPTGGTELTEIAALTSAPAAIQLGGLTVPGIELAAEVLERRFAVPMHRLPLPIGIRLTDRLCAALGVLAGRADRPAWIEAERGRLVDAYVDGHKYVAAKRVAIFGDEDLVVAMTAFCAEIGLHPVLCASGGRSTRLRASLTEAAPELADREFEVIEDVDFATIGEVAARIQPDLLIGHSKGYHVARSLRVPLVRVGLPIHDRLGGQRIQHLGYRGTQQLFDRIVNTLIACQQDGSAVGYSYM